MRITSSCPSASTEITADCLSTLPKLSSEKNTSEARLSTKTSSARITTGPACNAASVSLSGPSGVHLDRMLVTLRRVLIRLLA